VKRLRIAGSARRDLADIARYTEREWGARQRERYLAEIEARLRELRRNPGLGAERGDIRPDCRSLVVVSHVVFYREAEDAVEILRVLHHGMDVHLHLPGEPESES